MLSGVDYFVFIDIIVVCGDVIEKQISWQNRYHYVCNECCNRQLDSNNLLQPGLSCMLREEANLQSSFHHHQSITY